MIFINDEINIYKKTETESIKILEDNKFDKINDGYNYPWNVDDADPGNNWDVNKFTMNTNLSATSSGVVLNNGATATTQSQTYDATGDTKIATTQYVKTATTWWGGSAKFVSASAPTPTDGNDGDIWFQY